MYLLLFVELFCTSIQEVQEAVYCNFSQLFFHCQKRMITLFDHQIFVLLRIFCPLRNFAYVVSPDDLIFPRLNKHDRTLDQRDRSLCPLLFLFEETGGDGRKCLYVSLVIYFVPIRGHVFFAVICLILSWPYRVAKARVGVNF